MASDRERNRCAGSMGSTPKNPTASNHGRQVRRFLQTADLLSLDDYDVFHVTPQKPGDHDKFRIRALDTETERDCPATKTNYNPPVVSLRHGNPICTTQTSSLQTATFSNLFCNDGSEMVKLILATKSV